MGQGRGDRDQGQDQGQDQGRGRGRRLLTAGDWVDAALTAIGEGGLAAVSIEPLAARLGTTKGSFYWHFTGRAALIEAALERWEEINTENVLAAVDTEPDPALRLHKLFTAAPVGAGGGPVEVALLASAGHPQVAGVLQRVTHRRIGYLAQIFTELGFSADEAPLRALLAYTAHLGQIQLNHSVPDAVPADDGDRRRYLDLTLHTLLHRG